MESRDWSTDVCSSDLGSFAAQFVQIDIALEDNFTAGWNFQIDGFALDQLDGSTAKKAGDEVFLDLGRSRDDGRKGHDGIGADRDRDLHCAGGTVWFSQDACRGVWIMMAFGQAAASRVTAAWPR